MKSYFYGICLDGMLLRVAEFDIVKDRLSLLRLESFLLTKSLYTGYTSQIVQQKVNYEVEDSSEDYSFKAGNGELDPEDIDIFSEGPSKRETPQNLTEPMPLDTKPQSEFRSDAIYQFLSKFHLNSGKISMSCNENRVQWKVVKTSKKLNLNALKKLALTPEQMNDPAISCDFITDFEEAYNFIVHTGEFELLNFLSDSTKILYNQKKDLHYQYIEPYEISMLNIFNLFYPKESDKFTTFLYLGEEIRLGIVVKNQKLVKSFSIMIHDTDPQKIRETVYAKLMLEHESASHPIIENIVLAGSYATDEDIAYYNLKTKFQHQLFKLNPAELNKYRYNFRVSMSVKSETIPAFILPISLGLKGVLSKHKNSCKFNLLPKSITEGRKLFKVSWHSILLVILLALSIVYGANLSMEKKTELNRIQSQLLSMEAELEFLKNFTNIINEYRDRVEQLLQLNSRTAVISAEKNTWGIIIQSLSDFTNRNPLIWIENMLSQDTRFTVRGKSYHRDRITNLSNLFGSGHINRIVETTIAGHTVWDFEISFLRPHGAETSAMNFPPHLQTYEAYVQHIENLRRMQLLARSNVNVQTPDEPISVAEESATLYNLARNNYLSNNFTEAIALLERYIQSYPTGAEIALSNYLLGELYFVVNRFDRAVPYFLEVLRLQREQVPEALFFVSRSYESLGNYENALRYYTMLINRHPNNPLSATAREQIRILREGGH